MTRPAQGSAPVFLLTVDSLRADRFTPEYFPGLFESFVDDFVRFENAYSNGVATPFAFPAIMTGELVAGDGTLSPAARPLGTLAAGRTVGVSNNVHLSHRAGYDRGWDDFYPHGSRGRLTSLAHDIVSANDVLRSLYHVSRSVATDWLDVEPPPPYDVAGNVATRVLEELGDPVPSLLWAHFMDPHYPFTRSSVPDRDGDLDVDLSAAELAAANERYLDGHVSDATLEQLTRLYDASVRYLDRVLVDLLGDLRSAGCYEQATVVITADHGEVFGEHGYYNHQWDADPVDELVRVPLLVKPPGHSGDGGTTDVAVSHRDLYEALANVLTGEERTPVPSASPGPIVAKSNAAIRAIDADGDVTERRGGATVEAGSPTPLSHRVADRAAFPAIENLAGNQPGVAIDNHHLNERLEALGYQ